MKYVYLLKSARNPECVHLGVESDLNDALIHHNSFRDKNTAALVPWDVEVALRFRDHKLAATFRSYLDSKAGRAYMRKHFLRQSEQQTVWVE